MKVRVRAQVRVRVARGSALRGDGKWWREEKRAKARGGE